MLRLKKNNIQYSDLSALNCQQHENLYVHETD